MTKTTKTFCLEASTYEAAKKAGINISEAAERGILLALGTNTAVGVVQSLPEKYFMALDATDRMYAKQAMTTGMYKEPGGMGKVHKCPHPDKWLRSLLRMKYRFTEINDEDVAEVLRMFIVGGLPA